MTDVWLVDRVVGIVVIIHGAETFTHALLLSVCCSLSGGLTWGGGAFHAPFNI